MIETERLLLRKFVPDDLDWLARMRADVEIMKYITGAQSRGQVAERLQQYISFYDDHNFGFWALVHKQHAQPIGWCGLHTLDNTPEIEVGYGIDIPYWRQGLTTEAAEASLRYGFEQAGLERIVAVADPQNMGSWGVMEKLGMKFEKLAHYYGGEVVYYAISRADFRPRPNSLYFVHN